MEERYSRQIRFKQIGKRARKDWETAMSWLSGGALGTAGAEGLARAGVGTITIIDRDYVEWSNLQRRDFIQKAMPSSACRKPWSQRASLSD